MPISTIANGEAGSSVRTKLNSVIGAVNNLGTAANSATTDFATAAQGALADTAIQGSTGSNNNHLVRADGTGGKTVKASGIHVDNADNLTGVESVGAKSSTGLVIKTSAGDTVATFGNGGVVADLPSSTSIGTVTSAEIGYLSGVTSSIQTQINGKGGSTKPKKSPPGGPTDQLFLDTSGADKAVGFFSTLGAQGTLGNVSTPPARPANQSPVIYSPFQQQSIASAGDPTARFSAGLFERGAP